MRATVRAFHSPDAELETFRPQDPGDVGILVQVFAGPADGPGEESFDVMVVTPRWLDRHVREVGPLLGRHYLIVAEYDAREVQRFLTRAIERETADDWSQLGERLARIGHWEFEDYSE